MLHVIVIIASDGTLSVVGTKSGRPFTSESLAEQEADRWREDADLVVTPRLIEVGIGSDYVRARRGEL